METIVVAFIAGVLSVVWAWPYSEEIITTITAVDTFLGAVLCISTATYNKEVV